MSLTQAPPMTARNPHDFSIQDRARAAYADQQEREEAERRWIDAQGRKQHQESLSTALRHCLDVDIAPHRLPDAHGETMMLDGLRFGFPLAQHNCWQLQVFAPCRLCGQQTPAIGLDAGSALETLGKWLAEGRPYGICEACCQRPGAEAVEEPEYEDPFEDD